MLRLRSVSAMRCPYSGPVPRAPISSVWFRREIDHLQLFCNLQLPKCGIISIGSEIQPFGALAGAPGGKDIQPRFAAGGWQQNLERTFLGAEPQG